MFPFKVRRLTEELEKHINDEALKRCPSEYLVFKISGIVLRLSMFVAGASLLSYILLTSAVVYFYRVELSKFQQEIESFTMLFSLLVLVMLASSATHDHFYKKLQNVVHDIIRDTA